MATEITSGTSSIVFSVITLIYIILKQTLGYKYKNTSAAKTRKILLAIYIISVFMAQYSFNIQLTKALCGSVQTTSSFMMTVIPNVLMFGLIIIIFNFFPGWKAPFSNTIGYLAAWAGGIKKLFIEMIITAPGGRKSVDDIYNNPSLMINEITPANFDTFMTELLKDKKIGTGAKKYYDKLYKLVTLKDSVSEFFWYWMIGLVVITTSYNALTELSCNKNTDQMIASHNAWAKKNNTKTPSVPKKVYYTRE